MAHRHDEIFSEDTSKFSLRTECQGEILENNPAVQKGIIWEGQVEVFVQPAWTYINTPPPHHPLLPPCLV